MSQQNSPYIEDQIDLKDLYLKFWKQKKLIFLITSLFAVLSVIYSLSLNNIYSSSALLVPSSKDDSLASMASLRSSFSSFSGISLIDSPATDADEAVERIKSLQFFSDHFLPEISLENLMAVDSWNYKTNKIAYKKSVFDEKNNKWIRKAKYPRQVIPSDQEAFEKFKDVVTIVVDKKSSYVSISIEHQSPFVAKNWLDIIILKINESMRLEEMELSKAYINFLNESQKSTNIQSLKEVSSELLESQMQNLMLASSNKDYIFKIIDSPVVSERKSRPNRALICILGTIFGGILSLIVAYIKSYREES
tara:strand:- start:27532 stop:28452 length:921 start_codon:yes stop_codon:yes gene_type:complete